MQFGATRLPLPKVVLDRNAAAARPTVQRARGFDADERAFVFGENGQRCRLREGIKRSNSAR